MVYDTIVCTHADDSNIAALAINSVDHFLQSRKIFLITKPEVFKEIKANTRANIPLHFLNEDELIEGLNQKRIGEILNNRMIGEIRPNWYFQQFLKMAVSQLPEVADHYLIWDSDTILMKPITFFDNDGHIFFNPKTENHQPYFQLLEDLLNLKRKVNYSFIDQHLMIKKAFMKELIQTIQDKTPDHKPWFWLILQTIRDENFKNLGFSEFETYGNFVAHHYPNVYKPRIIKTARGGTSTFGLNPSKYDLFRLINIGFTAVTFECKQEQSVPYNLFQKMKSYITYLKYAGRTDYSEMRRDAREIVEL